MKPLQPWWRESVSTRLDVVAAEITIQHMQVNEKQAGSGSILLPHLGRTLDSTQIRKLSRPCSRTYLLCGLLGLRKVCLGLIAGCHGFGRFML